MIRLLITTVTLACSALIAAEPDWPQFRGPTGDGIAHPDCQPPIEFSKTKNLDWRTQIPGKGWSSPVVSGNSIWLTSAIEVKPSEEERVRLLEEAGEKPTKIKTKQIANRIKLIIVEVDLVTGRIQQEHPLTEIDKPDSIHNLNSYASPTPCFVDNKLYAHFGTYGTWCFDTQLAKVLWHNSQSVEHGVGPGSSPTVYEDLLIMIFDAVDQQYVTALDRHTGETKWKTARPEMRSESGDKRKAYSTPLVIAPKDEVDQVICLGAQWIVSYNPTTGKENWKVDHGDGFSVIPRPIFCANNQLIYFISGFPKPALWAIDPAGKEVWKETKRVPAKPSPIVYNNELYMITDAGIISCLDATTGELHWSERIIGNFSSSLLLANDQLYICNHEGTIYLVKPRKTYTPPAENQIDEQIMASPIAIGKQLIIRSADALYSLKESD